MRGFESIHFGQAEIVGLYDKQTGYSSWNLILSKIRKFAKNYNRGNVLCTTHLNEGMYFDPNPSNPLPNKDRILLFDFHQQPINMVENKSLPCTQTLQPSKLINNHNSLISKTISGINPQGWRVINNPFVLEFDNSDIECLTGCNYDISKDEWRLWGYDDISWFAKQPENYRNDILIYLYYKIKCFNNNGHFKMPIRRMYSESCPPLTSNPLYRCATNAFNQENTIKNIWNNTFAGNSNWVQLNFTNKKVINQPITPHVSSSLVLSGTDKMYYIANDGYIHGYIKDADLDLWYTVSPSYSAQIYGGVNVTNQFKAKSDITVSPDGNTILYIGIDDLIHGFNVVNPWNYTYFDFVKQPMISQNLKADKDLIFTSNTRVFYIAKENNGTGKSRVHGFIKYNGAWVTVSPTYASQVASTSMVEVGGALAYNSLNDRLYYVGIDGFLYYYTILNDWSYNYVSVPKSQLITQNLRIIPNKIALNGNSIYYIGKELTNGNALRIHELIDNAGTWITNSPTWSAQFNGHPVNTQTLAMGTEITVSPDGKKVAYIGDDKKVYYFEKLANSPWIYSYNKTFGADGIAATNSLQYTDNFNIYYNSKLIASPFVNGDNKVHNIKLEEAYCQNHSINIIEPNYTFTKIQNPNNPNDKILLEEKQVPIFPNPSNNEIIIILPNEIQDSKFTITNLTGTKLLDGTLHSNKNIIDCRNWSNGFYVITIFNQANKTVSNHKIIIEH